MTAKQKKQKAQDLILSHLAGIGYGRPYEEFAQEIGEDAESILKAQMDRIAKMFGYSESWFS